MRGVTNWIADQLPNSTLREIRGGDHFFPLTDPSRVIDHLVEHVERGGRR
jgi:pimeloyl-ACP methyl ester carboxylesterase